MELAELLEAFYSVRCAKDVTAILLLFELERKSAKVALKRLKDAESWLGRLGELERIRQAIDLDAVALYLQLLKHACTRRGIEEWQDSFTAWLARPEQLMTRGALSRLHYAFSSIQMELKALILPLVQEVERIKAEQVARVAATLAEKEALAHTLAVAISTPLPPDDAELPPCVEPQAVEEKQEEHSGLDEVEDDPSGEPLDVESSKKKKKKKKRKPKKQTAAVAESVEEPGPEAGNNGTNASTSEAELQILIADTTAAWQQLRPHLQRAAKQGAELDTSIKAEAVRLMEKAKLIGVAPDGLTLQVGMLVAAARYNAGLQDYRAALQMLDSAFAVATVLARTRPPTKVRAAKIIAVMSDMLRYRRHLPPEEHLQKQNQRMAAEGVRILRHLTKNERLDGSHRLDPEEGSTTAGLLRNYLLELARSMQAVDPESAHMELKEALKLPIAPTGDEQADEDMLQGSTLFGELADVLRNDGKEEEALDMAEISFALASKLKWSSIDDPASAQSALATDADKLYEEAFCRVVGHKRPRGQEPRPEGISADHPPPSNEEIAQTIADFMPEGGRIEQALSFWERVRSGAVSL